MECNKDEAVRAKEIADMKLEKQDYPGAKKFALKAQSLYPQLDGLSQLLATVDVHLSAANKVGDELDWYAVLGINPAADDESVRKQYRKLALMLHPDKNKSPGADGAFKLICDAWSLLSDKSKRLAYNQRRSSRGFTQGGPMRTGPSVPPQENGFYNYGNRSSPAPKAYQSKTQVPPASAPKSYQSKTQVPPTSAPRANQTNTQVPRMSAPRSHQSNTQVPQTSASRQSNLRIDTFWTICHECKMHYEYLKRYLNHTLLCPNCHKAFHASEAPPPFNHPKSSNSTFNRNRQQNLNNLAPGGNSSQAGRHAGSVARGSGPGPAGVHSSYTNSQQNPRSQTAGVASVDPAIAAKAANVVQQAQERMKRERDASQNGPRWEGNPGLNSTSAGDGLYKKARFNEDGGQYGANTTRNRIGADGTIPSVSAPRKIGVEPCFSSLFNKPSGTRELTPVETRNMLMGKAKKNILEKVNGWKSQTKAKELNGDKPKGKERKNEKEKRSSVGGQGHDLNGTAGVQITDDSEKPAHGDTEDPVVPSMSVPDPDFHDFDQDRTETCFGDNEVWAAYDDDDGMPRFYAMIHKVLSSKPFKLKISWLNSKTNSEFGTMDWVGSGFYKTCGEYRLGRYEINKSINSFSHKVQWSKGPRGVVQITPKKGDVWAVYRNWAPDWNEETPDEVIHKYDMMVVLDDYVEEKGVSIAPLVKVAGFKTVFLPHSDPEKVLRIPKEEMFRLSHQVPHYRLTGEEAQNAPKGCLELDPAATPLELLEVLTETNDSKWKEECAKVGGATEMEKVEKVVENSEVKGGDEMR